MGRLTEVRAQLDELCAVSTPGGSCRIVVWGPKGGSTKTTTAAALLNELSGRLAGLLVGVDANPDLRNLTQRLGMQQSRVPGRLYTLAQDPSAIRYLADWAPYLDRVGRIHLLHNDNVPNREVQALTEAQYTAAFDLLARYAEVQIIDLGQSGCHPSSTAAFRSADQLLIALPADAGVLRLATNALTELVDAGHGELLSRATVVLTVTQPRFQKDLYRAADQYLNGRVGDILVVPYDRHVGARCETSVFDKLTAPTRLAYAAMTRHVLASIRQHGATDRLVDTAGAPNAHSTATGCVPEWKQGWSVPIAAPVRARHELAATGRSEMQPGVAPSLSPEPLPTWVTRTKLPGAGR
ncbi:hypothetical protein [Nakamurella lactea]|uniref:hypothetical protein n=1 Tax=Nakamurella lactea TaxID=459515 RepID=UPI000426C6AC|nr:hypothetical protein [Nakamurella lactea]